MKFNWKHALPLCSFPINGPAICDPPRPWLVTVVSIFVVLLVVYIAFRIRNEPTEPIELVGDAALNEATKRLEQTAKKLTLSKE